MPTSVAANAADGFGVPNLSATRAQVDCFREAVLRDVAALGAHGARRGAVSDPCVDALLEALRNLHADDVRSELIQAYFIALETARGTGVDAYGQAILKLGNALLPSAAAGRIPGPLPVFADGEGVRVAAADPSYRARLAVTNQIASAESIAGVAGELLGAVAETWIAPAGGAAIGIRDTTAPVQYEIDKYSERTSALAGYDVELRLLDHASEDGCAVLRGLQEAIQLVHEIQPEAASEIQILTEYVVPLDGRQFVGGSDIFLFGATFLKLEPAWSTLCYADHLVHEAAHQLLHAVQEVEPLLLNRDQIGQPSPIRTDSRPLYGTFHATFVFLRLCLLMEATLDRGPSEFAEEAEIRLHRHLLGLRQGLQIIFEHGSLSTTGAAALAHWTSIANDLTTRFGSPDPRCYEQLDWDYEPADGSLPLWPV
ncbi:MAG: aKG-HExxH-type peptide beta-hydroxylase [Actinomycetota bacterium]